MKGSIGLPVQLILKRLVDILISLIGLILLAIPFAAIALAIKLDSKGPIFFWQERVGKGGKLFKTWKFRTLVERAREIAVSELSLDKIVEQTIAIQEKLLGKVGDPLYLPTDSGNSYSPVVSFSFTPMR